MEVYLEVLKADKLLLTGKETIDAIFGMFRQAVYKAMDIDEKSGTSLCIDLDKINVAPNMLGNEFYPNEAMFNHKHWRKNHMQEMEDYKLF
jgi:hypothetical protein